MIAGFWSDANLACPGSTNTVRHDESCDPGLLWTIESRVQDPDFRPTSAVVVKYDAVQSYSCPASCDVSAHYYNIAQVFVRHLNPLLKKYLLYVSNLQTNTFTVTIGIDQNSCRTYVIFDYESMGWNKATQSYNDPIVGYSNGQCQGFQASLGVDPKAYLNVCQTLKYRIDQSFAQEVRAQMNRGNLALVQQGKGPVFMQQQDKGREVAAMSGTRQEVIVQNFNEKNINAMENKLNRALQQAKK